MDDPISPLDGRYSKKTCELKEYFNEAAFFKYRLLVEIKYFLKLIDVLPELSNLRIHKNNIKEQLYEIYTNFDDNSYKEIKRLESITNHDVKALEYYISNIFLNSGIQSYTSFIHFGLTSQDINTTANMISLKKGIVKCIIPCIEVMMNELVMLSKDMANDIMLSFTHGQPAVPTTMGKELSVFLYRLEEQLINLRRTKFTTKFGGAVGNFNAHKFAYPDINWEDFGDEFIKNDFGLQREMCTTQISNYDNLCNTLSLLKTINNIVNDMNIDIWLYISKGYLKQKIVGNEVGSSTMPHKVNPINFENSEGNICIANSLIDGITGKLNISRLQRDLTDSTILRNIGVLFGYCLVAYKSSIVGLGKIMVDNDVITSDLNKNKVVLTEGIQTVMRKHGIENAYEKMKELSRGENNFDIEQVIYSLDDDKVKKDLDGLDVTNYVGYVI
jgi:adenylosuccinate lyase